MYVQHREHLHMNSISLSTTHTLYCCCVFLFIIFLLSLGTSLLLFCRTVHCYLHHYSIHIHYYNNIFPLQTMRWEIIMCFLFKAKKQKERYWRSRYSFCFYFFLCLLYFGYSTVICFVSPLTHHVIEKIWNNAVIVCTIYYLSKLCVVNEKCCVVCTRGKLERVCSIITLIISLTFFFQMKMMVWKRVLILLIIASIHKDIF